MTPEEIWAKRKERARRWAKGGYPFFGPIEDEAKETLAAWPRERAEKKPKPQLAEHFRLRLSLKAGQAKTAEFPLPFERQRVPLASASLDFGRHEIPRHNTG